MGLYVNPESSSKEEWLRLNLRDLHRTGDAVTGAKHAEILAAGRVPLVLVDNGMFTALGVLYDQREAADFARDDGRSKIFATVDRAALADDASGVGEDQLRRFGI